MDKVAIALLVSLILVVLAGVAVGVFFLARGGGDESGGEGDKDSGEDSDDESLDPPAPGDLACCETPLGYKLELVNSDLYAVGAVSAIDNSLEVDALTAGAALFVDKRLYMPTRLEFKVKVLSGAMCASVVALEGDSNSDSTLRTLQLPVSAVLPSAMPDASSGLYGDLAGAVSQDGLTLVDVCGGKIGGTQPFTFEAGQEYQLRIDATRDGLAISVDGVAVYATEKALPHTGFLGYYVAKGSKQRVRDVRVRGAFTPILGSPSDWAPPSSANPYGAAGFAEGTTGGEGGAVIEVSNDRELRDAAASEGALTILITKDFVMKRNCVVSSPNKTIQSAGDERFKIAFDYQDDADNEPAGFVILAPNVVIRRLGMKQRLFGPGDYAGSSNHMWVSVSARDNATVPVHHVLIQDVTFAQRDISYRDQSAPGGQPVRSVVFVHQLATHVSIQDCKFEEAYRCVRVENSLDASAYGHQSMQRLDLFNDLYVSLIGCTFESSIPRTDGNSYAPKATTGRVHVASCSYKNLNICVSTQGYASAAVQGCSFDSCVEPTRIGDQTMGPVKVLGRVAVLDDASAQPLDWSVPYVL